MFVGAMPVIKTERPWYEWAGEYLKEAMKGWGLATILILMPSVLLVHAAYAYGHRYVEASILRMQKEAEASVAVAVAVTELTHITKQGQQFQAQVREDHVQMMRVQNELLSIFLTAKTEMAGATENRELQTKLLQQIYNELKTSNGP